jgi:hypothetical protein
VDAPLGRQLEFAGPTDCEFDCSAFTFFTFLGAAFADVAIMSVAVIAQASIEDSFILLSLADSPSQRAIQAVIKYKSMRPRQNCRG